MGQAINESKKVGSVSDHIKKLSIVDRHALVYLGALACSFAAAILLALAIRYQYQSGVKAGIDSMADKIASAKPFTITKTSRIIYQCGRVDE